MRLQERVAQPEHAGLLPPGLDLAALLGLVERDAAEDGEAIGVQARCLDRLGMRCGVPARRMQNSAVDARSIHVAQRLVQ